MPQPIDPLTELARMHAAERIQQIADRASLAAQARAAAQAADAAVNKESQVQEMEPKGSEVDEALKRRAPFMGRRGKKRGEDEEEAQEPHDEHGRRRLLADGTGIDLDVSI